MKDGKMMKGGKMMEGGKMKDGKMKGGRMMKDGEMKDAVWQQHSNAWIQPCRKHAKTFILHLPSKRSLIHAAISSFQSSTPGCLQLLHSTGLSFFELIQLLSSTHKSLCFLLCCSAAPYDKMASLLQPHLCCAGSVPTVHSLTLPSE